MAEPIVVARDLTRVYVGPDGQSISALAGVDLDVYRGEVTVIGGPSGSGKSTLLQVLAGLDRPESGTVLIGGQDVVRCSDRKLSELRRRRIGFVFQSFNLIDSLNARDNITLPVELDGARVDHERLESLAESLGMAGRLDHMPYQLSGGQQQRVAVIRAMLTDPDVIFADEPTASLDPASGQQMIDMLRRVAHDFGHAVLVISHDPAVSDQGDKVYRMDAGHLALVVDRTRPAARADLTHDTLVLGAHDLSTA